jgi:carotenoid cleavage dioxygenase-like enzyme
VVIGASTGQLPPLPMEGSLPPDLEGTLFRVGPANGGAGSLPGALHAVELRDGRAVSYLRRESPADAGVFWHAGALLALPEAGMPAQYTRLLEPQEFTGGLTVPIASHVHRVAADGSRLLFAVDDGVGTGTTDQGVFLRLGEWDADGALRHAQSVALERATWQHDIGVTASNVVFIESPTSRLAEVPAGETTDDDAPEADVGAGVPRVPFGWLPGAEGWVGVVPRTGDGSSVRWYRVDPCLVTHVLGARDGADGEIVLYVCRYDVPKAGQPVDRAASVVGDGVGLSPIGESLPLLERWSLVGDHLERTQVDDRHVEYPRLDPLCEGDAFRFGYAVEMAWDGGSSIGSRSGSPTGVSPIGLLKFDFARDESAAWRPAVGAAPSEPLFARASDGHNDEEGWLLCLVDEPDRGATDLVVLDASSLGRRQPEAVIHLPLRLPLRAHGEWVPADRYR